MANSTVKVIVRRSNCPAASKYSNNICMAEKRKDYKRGDGIATAAN
jgi:hypothetical protein